MIINWPQAIIVAIIVALAGFGLHSLDVWRLDAQHQSDLTAQAKALRDICDNNSDITKEVDYATQSQISNLNTQYLSLERLRDSACPMSITSPPSGDNGAASGGKLAHKNAPTINALLDIAHDGEKYRLQLKGCQDFIKKTWDGNQKQDRIIYPESTTK